MVSSSELTLTASPLITEDSLRLLSVNEAREILKVRHETVRKLIEDGKIEVIIIRTPTILLITKYNIIFLAVTH